jgi:hypothetical protein
LLLLAHDCGHGSGGFLPGGGGGWWEVSIAFGFAFW